MYITASDLTRRNVIAICTKVKTPTIAHPTDKNLFPFEIRYYSK